MPLRIHHFWLPLGPLSFKFVRCLANALKQLRNHKIRHRDVKPDIILIHGQNIILRDFSRSLMGEEATQVGFTRTLGTTKYYAPEIFRQEGNPSATLVKRSSPIWGCVQPWLRSL
jgi:serine/threonine protein kinase